MTRVDPGTSHRPLGRRPTTAGRALAVLAVAALGTVGVVACSSTSARSVATTVPAPNTTFTFQGHLVSSQAKIVCSSEATGDMAEALGVKTTTAPVPGWTAGAYTCTYAYAGGAHFTLSVYDLASATAAKAYLGGLGHTLGRTDQVINLGSATAFITPTGNVVVQKDEHVLVVDVSGLPATWLTPPQDRSQVAQIVAAVVMGCWTGG